MTGKADWGFETQQGRIVGIYSRSSLVPYKQKGFNVEDAKLAGAKSYREWIFTGNYHNNLKNESLILSTQKPTDGLVNQPIVKSESNSDLGSVKEDVKTYPVPSGKKIVPGDRLRYDPDYN
jgi:hypothetical protein